MDDEGSSVGIKSVRIKSDKVYIMDRVKISGILLLIMKNMQFDLKIAHIVNMSGNAMQDILKVEVLRSVHTTLSISRSILACNLRI